MKTDWKQRQELINNLHVELGLTCENCKYCWEFTTDVLLCSKGRAENKKDTTVVDKTNYCKFWE